MKAFVLGSNFAVSLKVSFLLLAKQTEPVSLWYTIVHSGHATPMTLNMYVALYPISIQYLGSTPIFMAGTGARTHQAQQAVKLIKVSSSYGRLIPRPLCPEETEEGAGVMVESEE